MTWEHHFWQKSLTPDTDKLRELAEEIVTAERAGADSPFTPTVDELRLARGLLSVLDALEAKEFGGRYRALVDRCHAVEDALEAANNKAEYWKGQAVAAMKSREQCGLRIRELEAECDRLAGALRSIARLTDVADTPQSRRAWLSEAVRIARAALAGVPGEAAQKAWGQRGGYPAGSKPASSLKPPPSGPAAGADR